MKFLLDTHVLLWMAREPARLSARAKKAILAPDNERLMSIASFWEISIKKSLSKLDLPIPVTELGRGLIHESKVQLVPLSLSLLDRVAKLPFLHRDPFDRLLVAQALELDCPIVSHDERLSDYPSLKRIW